MFYLDSTEGLSEPVLPLCRIFGRLVGGKKIVSEFFRIFNKEQMFPILNGSSFFFFLY